MELQTDDLQQAAASAGNGEAKAEENGGGKRGREEGDDEEAEDGDAVPGKKQMVKRSVEDECLESLEEKGGEGKAKGEDGGEGEAKEKVAGGDEKAVEPVKVGPKVFNSSVEMFDYFYKLLHSWPPNVDVNKYEHLVLMDLLMKGHPEHGKKIGGGVQAFQIRYHPLWKSRCFFIIRIDGSVEDFSFRKCVDRILPLPENMKATESNKVFNGNGGRHRGGGRGSRGGRGGRGRRGRH